ncbi:MAG TPA: ABC transporter permease subunit [Haliangiales bacterium]|nr:ABC transporter permease subunit [Haliangiales bacterium]
MSFLPVIERELRVAARRPATYWTRLAFGLVGAGVVSLALVFAAVAETGASRVGSGLFSFLSLLGLGFSAFAGVFLTADCLSEEKREGTLGLLLLTDLKGYDVVLGKLLARSLSAGYGLLAIFPVLAVTLTMGGVTAGEFWRMALVFLNTIFFSLAAGMFVSALILRDHRSMAGAAALIVFIGAALPLAESILNRAGLGARFALSLPSPFTAWQLAFDAPHRMWARSFGYSLLLTHLLSWLFLLLAGVQLPLFQRGNPGSISRVGGRPADVSDRLRSRRATGRRPLLDRNPIFWLTIRNSRMTGVSWAIWTTLAIGVAWTFARDPMVAVAMGQYSWSFLAGLLRILVGVYACRFFAEARRGGALELLLCTPLTVEDILRGQWMALRRLFLVPTIALLCVGIMPLGLILFTDLRNAFPAWIMMGSVYIYSVPKLIFDLLAAAWMGMLVGLTTKKPHLAPGLTMLYTVVLPVAAFCIPDVLISLPLFLWARDKLYRELRALSSPRGLPVVPQHRQGKGPAAAAPPVIRH